jgi:hypothetical protein
MSSRVCKAAIDCTGFLYELDRTVDLIMHEHITDPEAIDAFNDMKTKFEQRYEAWKAQYVDFDAP